MIIKFCTIIGNESVTLNSCTWLANYRAGKTAGVSEDVAGRGNEGANAAFFGIPILLMHVLQASRKTLLVVANPPAGSAGSRIPKKKQRQDY